jgi:hypothetical protein
MSQKKTRMRPGTEFLNIKWRLKVDFSRRPVFSNIRVHNRAHSGYNFVVMTVKTFLGYLLRKT